MTTATDSAYLATPQAAQAGELLLRAGQDALGGVVGQGVTVEVEGRRAVSAADLTTLDKNVLIELQFERPLDVHHSIVVLATADTLVPLCALTPSADAAEVLDAEALLSLGDIASTFLDTLVGELSWLQPTPRAWLANLEPLAQGEGASLDLPALLADQALHQIDLVLTAADGQSCPVQVIIGEPGEQALLGLDGNGIAEVAEVAEVPGYDEVPAAQGSAAPAQPSAAPQQAAAPVQAAQFKPLGPDQSAGRSSSIDLIRDVPLQIAVELGRASLTVREILALGVGSVVELDRLHGEAVDVLVNDRLIARGEVVIVDESFGVRVTEIVREAGRKVAS